MFVLVPNLQDIDGNLKIYASDLVSLDVLISLRTALSRMYGPGLVSDIRPNDVLKIGKFSII